MLGKDMRLKVRVAEDPHFLDSSALHRYDVVVLHFMNWQQPAPGPKARANLRKFVQDGKGLFVVHFGCGVSQSRRSSLGPKGKGARSRRAFPRKYY
jgi:hypothetical protein